MWHNFDHPNVVRLLGIASGFGNTTSTVAPWISGGKLHKYLAEKDSQLDLPARFRLVISVLTPPIWSFVLLCGRSKVSRQGCNIVHIFSLLTSQPIDFILLLPWLVHGFPVVHGDLSSVSPLFFCFQCWTDEPTGKCTHRLQWQSVP